MAEQSKFVLHLDDDSQQLLDTFGDGILLGVIEISRNEIKLYRGSPATDVATRSFAGHRDLVRIAGIDLDGTAGFSVQLLGNAISAFYRTSILNRSFDDYAIPDDMMGAVVAAMNRPLAAGFCSYP